MVGHIALPVNSNQINQKLIGKLTTEIIKPAKMYFLSVNLIKIKIKNWQNSWKLLRFFKTSTTFPTFPSLKA